MGLYITMNGNYEIYRMNSSGGELTRLTTNSSSDQQPRLAPDGTKIVFLPIGTATGKSI